VEPCARDFASAVGNIRITDDCCRGTATELEMAVILRERTMFLITYVTVPSRSSAVSPFIRRNEAVRCQQEDEDEAVHRLIGHRLTLINPNVVVNLKRMRYQKGGI
jgi:hypothetical protein